MIRRPLATLCSIVMTLVSSSLCAQPSTMLEVGGVREPIKGINLAWLNGACSHDFGILPSHPDWLVAFNERDLDAYLADMRRMNLNVVRIFVFEDLEGLVFEDGYVKRIDGTLLSNFDKMMPIARKHGLHLYLSLSNNFWKACRENGFKNIITNREARRRYLDNAVKPFVARYSGDTVFAFEVMSEPEHVVAGNHGNWTKDGCSWEQMRVFIRESTQAIHSADSRRLVSAGSGWHYFENVKAGLYSNLGLDFYDFHTRLGVDGPLPHVRELRLDKPVIIGEFNIDASDKTMTEEKQRRLCLKMLNEAKNGGYAGALMWCYDFPGQLDPESKALSVLRCNGSSEWKSVGYAIRDFKWSE